MVLDDASEIVSRLDRTVFTEESLAEDDMETDDYLPLIGQTGFISVGESHILASDPKAGKTELLFQSVASWKGYQVLWFTEENRRVWRKRLRLRGPHVGKVPHITWDYAMGKYIAEKQYIINAVLRSDADVIIIDTVRSLLGIAEENEAGHVAQALIPYVKACGDSGKTLIVVHHERKAGGTFGQGLSGSQAFGGIVDTILELKRDPRVKTDPNYRKLEVLGRVDVVGEIEYTRLPTGELAVTLGSGGGLEAKILQVLDGQWKTTSEIVSMLPEPKSSVEHVRKTMLGMVYSVKVERDPPVDRESKGKTVKWRKK